MGFITKHRVGAALGALAAYKLYKSMVVSKKMSFKSKSVLITGAAGGVGRSLCLELAKLPASELPAVLILWDILEDGMKETERMIKEINGSIKTHVQVINLCEKEQIYSRAKDLIGLLGDAPDVVVNNAGFVAGGTLLNLDDNRIMAEYKINVLANVFITKAFLQTMIDSPKPKFHLVSVASMAAFVATGGQSTYSASKFAVRGFWSSMDNELQGLKLDHKIKISVLLPGHMSTELFKGFDVTMNKTITPEFFARELIRAVQSEIKMMPVPVSNQVVYFSLAWMHLMGKFNLPLPGQNTMAKWDTSKADKIFSKF